MFVPSLFANYILNKSTKYHLLNIDKQQYRIFLKGDLEFHSYFQQKPRKVSNKKKRTNLYV